MKVAASAVTNTVNTYSIISDNNTAEEAMVDSVIYNHNKGIKADPDRSAPIGLFDSGIGGLSVYLHLAQQLPNESYIYYADTLNVPYGNRDSDDIKTLTLTAVEWLYQQGCKLIVIACNSASAYALQTARCHYPQLPIVGLVPALKPAVLASKSGHVAVLATKATLNGKLLNDVIATIASPSATRVTKYFDPQLVPWVESGMPENSETAQNLRGQLQVFAKDGVDQLVLGCTHYPFFKDFVMQAIESQRLSMQVVDSGQAIAERVKQLLIVNNLSALPIDGLSRNGVLDASLSDSQIKPPLIFYATKDDKQMDLLLSRLLGEQTHLQYHPHFGY
ncbi:glutamate racemase [Psychrobacter cryohalolentis]|uniref:glutamate racemase n=1 Tax=Psychrobacter cryohalolentis TaxID=330922 RepID=UPI003F849D93